MALVKYTQDVLEAVDEWDGIMSAPSKRNRKRIHGITVLENRLLEKYFATSKWYGPLFWVVPLVAWSGYLAVADTTVPLWLDALIVGAGVLGWTLLEYILHRWVFHATPRGPKSKFNIFMMHGYHHEFPSDPLRLVAPPVLAWPIAALVIPGYYFGAGPHYFAPMLVGTALGYLAYDWIHYYTHHARPKTRIGKFLRRYHMEHHFKDQSTHFGLSSPLWDLVFGTYTRPTEPEAQEIEILGPEEAEPTAQNVPPIGDRLPAR